MSEKIRLDALLVMRGLVSGRDRAKGYIMAGHVYVDEQKADKPGMEVKEDCRLELRAEMPRYVSRGGLKLEKAILQFQVRLDGCICADIGASTGGFTDCMLQNGAARVYAVDVGYGQLAWTLRGDKRVVVLERTNVRHVTAAQIPDPLDFVGIDVSFISLALVLPVAYALLREAGTCVCLIKPQFEAGKGKVGKKGVVRDKSVHIEVVEGIVVLAKNLGFAVLGLDYSPIKGPEGNIEYLLYLQKSSDSSSFDVSRVREIVTKSHSELQVAT